MIDKDNHILDMVANILDKVKAIQLVLKEDGKIYYSYLLEKTKSAKHDLDILHNFALNYDGLSHSEEWECPKSPDGFCAYNDDEDSSHDNCIYCNQPEERK